MELSIGLQEVCMTVGEMLLVIALVILSFLIGAVGGWFEGFKRGVINLLKFMGGDDDGASDY